MPSLRDASISDNFFSAPVDLDASRAASSLDGSGGALSRRSSGLLERQSSAAAGVFRPSGWGADAATPSASAPATLDRRGSTDAAAAAAAAAAGGGEEAGAMRLKLQRLLHESASYDSRALLRSVPLYLPYISRTSPLYLPYISSARCALPACNPVYPRCKPTSSGCNRTSSGCNPSCRGCASRHQLAAVASRCKRCPPRCRTTRC